MKIILCLFIGFIYLLSFSGCYTSGKNRTGELSDAMEEASDQHTGDRKVETEFSPSPENEQEDSLEVTPLQYTEHENVGLSSSSEKYLYSSLFLRLGSGVVSSKDLYGLNGFNINLRNRISKRSFMQFYVGYSFAPIHVTSKLSNSLDSGVKIFELGAEGVLFTTPPYTFFGHYVLLGFEYDIMYWKYKNPFYADVYDDYGHVIGEDLIKSDILSGIDFHLGSGINLIQTLDFQLGAEIIPGVKVWWFESYEGFNNDIFKPFFYIKVRFTVNFVLNRNE